MLRNGLEPWHVIVLVLVILLVFGGRKLPELARGSGRALRIFKAETKGVFTDDDDDTAARTPGELGSATTATTDQPTASTLTAPSAPVTPPTPPTPPAPVTPTTSTTPPAQSEAARHDAGTD